VCHNIERSQLVVEHLNAGYSTEIGKLYFCRG